jgi:hypothetical protein
MNRLKLWAFALLVLAAGATNLFLVTQWLARSAVAEADRALTAAAAQLDARSQLLAAQASALAEAAARAPAVLAALSEGGAGDPAAAAGVAVAAAARGIPAEQAQGFLVGVSGPEGSALRAGGKRLEMQDPAGGLFAEPLRGVRREGYARASEAIWLVSAVPAGKGAVAVGLPVDRAWAQALRAAGGAEVTIAAGQPAPISTLGGADLGAVIGAAKVAQPRAVDAGELPSLRTGLPGLPPLPLLLARVPGHRVQVVALRGMKSGLVALSVPMAAAAAPIAAYQAVSTAVLLLLLLVGLVLGLLVTSEVAVGVPRELLQAADRIQRGDYGARVAPLAGSMGTVASALNRAAEAAEYAARSAPPPPDPFAAAPPAAEPDPFALPALSHLAGARAAAPAPDTSSPDLFAPAPEPRSEPPPEQAYTPLSNSISGATNLSTRPEDLVPAGAAAPEPPARPLAPAPGPTPPPAPAFAFGETPPPFRGPTPPPVQTAPLGWPPAPARTPQAFPVAAPPPATGAVPPDPDAGHWQEVFQEFLRIRAACGEATEGLTADRFIAKLQQNRTSLMQKHDCRTVRFQVYVKEGRAAIKATPVR